MGVHSHGRFLSLWVPLLNVLPSKENVINPFGFPRTMAPSYLRTLALPPHETSSSGLIGFSFSFLKECEGREEAYTALARTFLLLNAISS